MGRALPTQPPLTPGAGDQGGRRDERGPSADRRTSRSFLGEAKPKNQAEGMGEGEKVVCVREARRASRKLTGRSLTRTESVTAIETRQFAPDRFQPENVFGNEEGVSSRRVSRVE